MDGIYEIRHPRETIMAEIAQHVAPTLEEDHCDVRPESAHDRYLRTRTFTSLNGLRGLSILAVIWHHAPGGIDARFLDRGFLGVDLFFVLSGFLIVTLLLRERDRTGGISLRKFYARRTLRIFPIYYLILLLVSAAYLVTKPGSPPARAFFASLPFLVTYTSNWVHLASGNMSVMWSLATEEQFYLVWPMIEKLLRPAGVALALAAILIVNQLINFGVLDGVIETLYGGKGKPTILQTTFTPIALGVLLAHLLNTPRSFRAMYGVLGHPGSGIVLAAVLVALIQGWSGDISGMGRLLMQLTMMFFLGSLVIREDHWLRPLMSFAPLAYVGLISYGIYVYHMWAIHPVRVAFTRLGWPMPSLAYFALSLAAAVLVAGLSFRFFEQPILRLKSRLASGVNEPAPQAD